MTQPAVLSAADTVDPDHELIDHVILTTDSKFAYHLASSYAEASAALGQYLQRDEAKFRDATIMTLDAFTAAREQSYLDDPIVEIDEAGFDYALNCLPPLEWRKGGGVEVFCMSEFTSGRITRQYARMGDRYFSRSVRYRDPETYLTVDSITAALEAGTVQPAQAPA